jgi:hypothetical protein
LFIATALGVDRGGGQGQPLYRVDDEVDQIILGHRIAQVWGQQEGVLRSMVLKRCAMLP